MLEISSGDFREQIELAGIQGSDAADMLQHLSFRIQNCGFEQEKKIQV